MVDFKKKLEEERAMTAQEKNERSIIRQKQREAEDTVRMNFYKDKGIWEVYGGRSGKGLVGEFGNPVVKGRSCLVCHKVHEKNGDTLPCYKKWLWKQIKTDAEYRHKVRMLAGKKISCFCYDNNCHVLILIECIKWLWSNEGVKQFKPDGFTEDINKHLKTETKEEEEEPIKEFQGEYRWLSNFTHVTIQGSDGLTYPSVENLYQAFKFDSLDREPFTRMTSAEAKHAGRGRGSEAFDRYKIQIMRDALIKKFEHPVFRKKLLATGNREIQEGNYWGDKFWGICLKTGEGQNNLGKIIMNIRDSIRAEEDGH